LFSTFIKIFIISYLFIYLFIFFALYFCFQHADVHATACWRIGSYAPDHQAFPVINWQPPSRGTNIRYLGTRWAALWTFNIRTYRYWWKSSKRFMTLDNREKIKYLIWFRCYYGTKIWKQTKINAEGPISVVVQQTP
jgi:hypothetical protein